MNAGLPILRLEGLEKTYRTGRVEYRALCGADLTVERGELVSIVGPSGSGKSTLLNVITGIDRPTLGSAFVAGLALWRPLARAGAVSPSQALRYQ